MTHRRPTAHSIAGHPVRLAHGLWFGVALWVSVATPAQAALLVNGSFEEPDSGYHRDVIGAAPPGYAGATLASVPGWTHSGSGVEVYESEGQDGIALAHDGHYWVSWGHNPSLIVGPTTGGILSQDFAVAPGGQYGVSFWLSTQQFPGTSPDQVVNVAILNPADASVLYSGNYTINVEVWTNFIFGFTAASGTARIVFTDLTTLVNSGPVNWALDDVAVTAIAAAVPAPAPLALLAPLLSAWLWTTSPRSPAGASWPATRVPASEPRGWRSTSAARRRLPPASARPCTGAPRAG